MNQDVTSVRLQIIGGPQDGAFREIPRPWVVEGRLVALSQQENYIVISVGDHYRLQYINPARIT